MAGHSKWANIKHRKARTDSKRAKEFTVASKELTLAAREGGGDPAFNNRLRLALSKARAVNMPNDNIDRAVKRGTGELEGGELVEITYEAYAPHGVGLIVEVVTDNKNRAVAEVRHVFNKYGGSLAESGAVSWQFTRKAQVTVEQSIEDEDEFFLLVADAGADDVEFGETTEVYSDLDNFKAVRDAIEAEGIEISEAGLIYDPNNLVELETSQALQVMNVLEKLEELDDVQNVFSAIDITDEVLAAME
jgi:YebC/PmpR family DNA-binding regulatory protein